MYQLGGGRGRGSIRHGARRALTKECRDGDVDGHGRRTGDELDRRGGREGGWDRRGVVLRGNRERLPAGRRCQRVSDRWAMGRRVVVAGALSHPPPSSASGRPGALQRHGDRQLEQRLGRRELRASQERGAARRRRVRRRRCLRAADRCGRRRWCRRDRVPDAGTQDRRPGAVRIVGPSRRRLLLRHLHPGRAAAGTGPSRRTRPVTRLRRAPRHRHRRLTVRRPAHDLLQRRPSPCLRLRRLPVDGVAERTVRTQCGIGARVVTSHERTEPLRPPRLSHVSAPRRPHRRR